MTKENDIKFKIVQISVERFAILKEPPQDKDEVRFGYALDFKSSSGGSIIAPVIKIVFTNKKQEPFVILDVLCAFEIESNSWKTFTQEDGSIIIPKLLLIHMVMHTIGTARGVMHCRAESTTFNELIVPAINIEEWIESDLIIPAVKP